MRPSWRPEGFVISQTRLPWDRLQSLLEGLHPGDELHLGPTAKQTGLDLSSCETVLEALTKIDLFTRTGDQTYVRRRMLQPVEAPPPNRHEGVRSFWRL